MTDDERTPHLADGPDWPRIARALATEGRTALAPLAGAGPGATERARMLAALADLLAPPAVAAPPADAVDRALRTVLARRELAVARPTPSPWGWARRGLPAAAAATVIVAVGAWWLRAGHARAVDAAPVAAALATGVGQVDSLRLPDGTRVILGPSSSLDTATGYARGRREATLRGIALFDVTHDAARPFTVHTRAGVLRDIGTSFVVRTDAAAGLEVEVREGSVALRRAGEPAGREQLLARGDRATLPPIGPLQVARTDPGDADIAWTRGRLVLRDASIADVGDALRRWYGLALRVDDSTLATRRVTASFDHETGAEAARIIAATLGARVRLVGDTAVFSPSPAPR